MDDVSWIPLAYFRLYWIRCKFYSDNRETFSFETLKFLAVVNTVPAESSHYMALCKSVRPIHYRHQDTVFYTPY